MFCCEFCLLERPFPCESSPNVVFATWLQTPLPTFSFYLARQTKLFVEIVKCICLNCKKAQIANVLVQSRCSRLGSSARQKSRVFSERKDPQYTLFCRNLLTCFNNKIYLFKFQKVFVQSANVFVQGRC